ncbi:MAG: YdeI/OmpD-associated family protein [Pseudomonadota bacterium]
MSHDPDRFEHVEVQSPEELWQWMAAHHGQDAPIWLVTWKAAHRDKYVSRDTVLDVLIAYGWVDGRRMKLDDDRTMQLLAPRKEQAWAQTYKDRAARLEAEGLMQAPGRAAIARAKQSGKWNAMAKVDALEEPEDLVQALSAHDATSWWDQAAPSYRRNILRWIAGAKTEATRSKRIGIASEHAARGEKVPQY